MELFLEITVATFSRTEAAAARIPEQSVTTPDFLAERGNRSPTSWKSNKIKLQSELGGTNEFGPFPLQQF